MRRPFRQGRKGRHILISMIPVLREAPAVAAHVVDIAGRAPAQQGCGLLGIGIAQGDVACAAGADLVGNGAAGSLFEGLDDFQNAGAVAGAQVDGFCAGVAVGLTYGKGLGEACEIGTMLAASVIVTTESVCPRFQPRELGLDIDVID